MNATIAPARSRYREFEVVIRGREGEEFIRAGCGVTLADVIDEQEERYGRELAAAMAPDGELPESFDEDFGDRIVWDRGRAVAVLRPTASGAFDVVRLGRMGVARKGGAR